MDLVPSVTYFLNLDQLNILPYPTPHGLFLDLLLDGPYEYNDVTLFDHSQIGSSHACFRRGKTEENEK